MMRLITLVLWYTANGGRELRVRVKETFSRAGGQEGGSGVRGGGGGWIELDNRTRGGVRMGFVWRRLWGWMSRMCFLISRR